tara:strand:- start:1152 stop:1691 length:540 start_codon:yes stop_codon:yes gene_type:complete
MGKTLISTQTASASSTLSFTSGIDSTYPVYEFQFINIHPASSTRLQFQVDTGTNTSYNQTIQSAFFYAYHNENGSSSGVGADANRHQNAGTSFQDLCGENISSGDNDASMSGTFTLYDPSSSTFVKQFLARTSLMRSTPQVLDSYCGGYINQTTAITRVQFKMNSGNIDSGKIKMFGVG